MRPLTVCSISKNFFGRNLNTECMTFAVAELNKVFLGFLASPKQRSGDKY
jgi:hypothetical protein